MLNLKGKIAVPCRVRRAPIPATRDPFINAHLLALGPGPDGRERFWTSSHNMVQGATAVVLDEDGNCRLLRPGVPHWKFCAAVQEDANTLWLCDRMSHVLRCSLRDGTFESHATGAPAVTVGQGPVFDRATGKLFIAGFHDLRTVALSFDTRAKRTVKLHRDFKGARVMRCAFPNGDGTWSLAMTLPGQSLLVWDPRKESLTTLHLTDTLHMHAPLAARLIADERGRRYIPERGWFDPRTRRITRRGPRPEKEMTWFARRGSVAYGAEDHDGSVTVHAWDLCTGVVRWLCEIPDTQVFGCNLTRSGKIVAVSVYGVFYRFDAQSGALDLSKALPTVAVSHVDCLVPVNSDRLLGTPFITQRFWELDLKTCRGRDCGRAAPGWGEIGQTWKLGGKVYMAAYIGGELMEYDPAQAARFPENPRVVAKPHRGQRPVAAADDGRRIFYACTRPYPDLGSVLTCYDTRTGLAVYSHDPLPDQKICGLAYLRAGNALLCGTSMHADMKTGAPSSDRCYLARLSAATLKVEQRVRAPKGTEQVNVIGQLDRRRWLCTFALPHGTRWAAVDPRALAEPAQNALHALPGAARRIQGTGLPGRFLLRWADRIELWDMRAERKTATLVRGLDEAFCVGGIFVWGRTVYLATPFEIVVLEGALR